MTRLPKVDWHFLTDREIVDFCYEAGVHGDERAVEICRNALGYISTIPKPKALSMVADMINAARAQDDEGAK